MRTFIFCLFAVVLACSAVSTASAQRSNTEKLFLHVTIDGQVLTFDEDGFSNSDTGGGLSLRAGWGVTQLVTLYLGLNGARMEGRINRLNYEYDWGAFEIGSRFNFRSGEPFVPFVDVALRAVAAQQESIDLEFLGGGLTIGGGAAYFVTPYIAFNAGFRLGLGGINEIRFGNLSVDVDANDFGYGEQRFSVGMVFYPIK